MTWLGLPTTIEKARDFIELWTVYWRGFSRELLLRCFCARYHATGEFLSWRDFLLAVQRSEFDYMMFDHGQSLS